MNDCEQAPAAPVSIKPIAAAFVLTFIFFIVELFGGIWIKSLALVADALHMAMDLAALGMSLFAAMVSRRPPDGKRTFGYRRIEVLAGLANGVILWVATGIILREAYTRFYSPSPVAPGPMMAIAALGLLCNIASGVILYSSSKKNINMRGAFINVSADAFGSLGALVASIVILKTGWYQADALAGVIICAGIIFTSYWLLRDSIHILLEGVPAHLNLEEIRRALSQLPSVEEIHDLHLWSLTHGSESMSGHVVVKKGGDTAAVLKAATDLLKEKFNLTHVTLQIESQ